ncbi:PDGLE domain-containing protein [Syntrophomonas curvata]
MFKTYKKLWWGLVVLIALSPLGLLATGTAFGEWSTDELIGEVGFIPAGLSKFADFWQHVLLPDYSVPGLEAGFTQSAVGYIFSAVVGILLVVLVISIFYRMAKD